MNREEKKYISIGTGAAFRAGIGAAFDAALGNLVLWTLIGASQLVQRSESELQSVDRNTIAIPLSTARVDGTIA